jgi:putative endonuclease
MLIKIMKNNQTKNWYVYILECLDGSYYTGVTNDIDARMKAHAEGKGSKYVYKKGFKGLLQAKACKDKSEACKCEYAIKKLPRGEKLSWFE